MMSTKRTNHLCGGLCKVRLSRRGNPLPPNSSTPPGDLNLNTRVNWHFVRWSLCFQYYNYWSFNRAYYALPNPLTYRKTSRESSSSSSGSAVTIDIDLKSLKLIAKPLRCDLRFFPPQLLPFFSPSPIDRSIISLIFDSGR